jgi:hypothetical protein
LQSFVNATFAPAMTATGADGQYVPLENWRPEIAGRPIVVALPVPRPYGDYGRIVNFRIDESLPEVIGAFADWLVNKAAGPWTKTVVRSLSNRATFAFCFGACGIFLPTLPGPTFVR